METQIFHGDVGQAVAGDLVNSGVVINVGSSIEGPDQDLVPAQRRVLNALVRTICEEFDDLPWEVWRVVHAKLGVTSVNELSRRQFHSAEQLLQNLLDERREASVMRGLVAKVLRVANERCNLDDVERFCTREFGTPQFKLLNRQQLQGALGFAYDWTPVQTSNQGPIQPIPDEGNRRRVFGWELPTGWQWLAVAATTGFLLGWFF